MVDKMPVNKHTKSLDGKTLCLITASYPYGRGEQFLSAELSVLSQHFNIQILPVFYGECENRRDVPVNVRVFKPILGRGKLSRVIFGLFNVAPIFPFISEGIELIRNHGFSRGLFLNFFNSVLVARSMLSSKTLLSSFRDRNCTCYFYWATFPIGLLKQYECKFIVRVHSAEADLQRNSGYIPFVHSIFIRNSRILYLPVSNQSFSNLANICDVHAVVSRLGISSPEPRVTTKDFQGVRVVSCSALIPLKRVNLIIESISKVDNIKIEWFHFGDGPLMQEVKAQASKMPDNIKVVLMGQVDNDQLMDFYGKTYIDLFVNTSEFEGIPVSIMEAMAFGIPIFATDVGGTREIVSNDYGFVVHKDSVSDSLSFAIEWISNNFTTVQIMRTKSRKAFEFFSDSNKNYQDLVVIIGRIMANNE